MARVSYVKKARASKFTRRCKRCGHVIEAGEAYKYADLKTGPTSGYTIYFCSEHNARQSDLTSNDRLSRLYAAQESVEDVLSGDWDFASLASALESAADEAESVAEEYEESASNMEEYFQGSYQVDEIREKGEACTEWAQELRDAAQEIEQMTDENECAECGQEGDDPCHDQDNEEEYDHDFELKEDKDEARSKAEEALQSLNL